MPVTILSGDPSVDVMQSIPLVEIGSPRGVLEVLSDSDVLSVLSWDQVVDVVSDAFSVDIIGPRSSELPSYPGPYSVTPTLEGLSLFTANKSTRHDIEVEPIPTSTVSNPQGGYTFMIG
jgi:hypothetical protein